MSATVHSWLSRRWTAYWAKHRAWNAGIIKQDEEPASYALVTVERAKTVASWLMGLNGAALLLVFTFYIQAVLTIPSVKGDCLATAFVANVMRDLNTFMRLCLISAVFALAARILPAVLNIGRNYLRWIKAQGLRPLDLENGLESWSNFNVIGRVAIPAWTLIIVSSLLFLLLLGIMVFSNFGSEPGALQNTWSKLELQCPHPPALDGVS